MTTETAHHEAHSEKQHAALSSLFWALFLTLIKLGAGLATNSLGILSEALHSSLDLVAAGITFFAVRVAARPADETHPYGYGKIENLSALAETVLLLVTCGWIVHEAVNRLFFDAPEITPSWWGVIIILISLMKALQFFPVRKKDQLVLRPRRCDIDQFLIIFEPVISSISSPVA